MLAILGFSVAALCFGAFAYTFDGWVVPRTSPRLRSFALAYYLLAAAFLVWSVASATGTGEVLTRSVLMGELFLLAGAVALMDVVAPAGRRYEVLVLSMLAALSLLAARALYLPPQPEVQNGIVLFRIAPPVAMALGALILGLWLPASLRVARQVTDRMGHPELRSIYQWIYLGAAGSAVLFVASHQPLTLVASFAALSISAGLLIASNLMVTKAHGLDQAVAAAGPAVQPHATPVSAPEPDVEPELEYVFEPGSSRPQVVKAAAKKAPKPTAAKPAKSTAKRKAHHG